MKTLLLPTRPFSLLRHRLRRAFSLVEVTLALGIITFGLVGIVGVLPTALASGRQSFDQNRAAAIANTIFASVRSQSFTKVGYVDEQFKDDGTTLSGSGPATIDLRLPNGAAASSVEFYAKFLNLASDTLTPTDAYGSQRRLSFTASQPVGGADYRVALNFYEANTSTAIPASNQPEGMVTTGQACRLELVINAVSRPQDQYRFVSTVANRFN